MPTRRIVTGEVDGRSRVISDGAVEAATNWEELWTLDVTAPLSTTAGETSNVLVPARGIARWRLFAIPNEDELRRRALEVARQLRSGTVGHNAFRSDFSMGFGGFMQSGVGREGGREGLLPYLETKSVILNDVPTGYGR
jgi:hypothetical protein